MISGPIGLIVYLVFVGLVLWLLRYLINASRIDSSLRRIANVVILVVGALLIMMVLLEYLGFTNGLPPLL